MSNWTPQPHQEPPSGTDWETWCIIGGRGAGKTRAGCEYVMSHLREQGASARVGIGAPTFGDARDVCAEGPSGFIYLYRDEFRAYNRSTGEAWHQGGGYVKLIGSEEPSRWNGPQWSLLWADEWPLWNLQSWTQAQFGLRLGAWPRAVVTGTPKAISMHELRALLDQPGVVVTRGTSFDNPGIDQRRVQSLVRQYGETTLGLSELYGELAVDVEGALWRHEWIERSRVHELPEMQRLVVAVDPAGGNGNQSAQTGLCAAGRGLDGAYYVLRLQGVQLSPDAWLRLGCDWYDALKADALVIERNYGGPFIVNMLDNARPDVNRRMVDATRGKAVRAEPIAALYERGAVHHVGLFEDGEAQLCSFPLTKRKDMTDALVWAITDLIANEPAGSWDDAANGVSAFAGGRW